MQPNTDILLHQSPDGAINLDVQLEQETVWLTQAQMSELFEKDRSVIGKHLGTIFSSGELTKSSCVQKMHIIQIEENIKQKSYERGTGRPSTFYNLDVIISVGYRVNSKKGTQFRQWATRVLREHLVQGFVLNEKRLRESQRQLSDLKRLVQLQSEVAANQVLTTDEAAVLLHLLGDYARVLDVLDQLRPPAPARGPGVGGGQPRHV